MAEQKIKATRVFQKNYEAFYNDKNRFIINVGGSRSSKTYSLCQLLIIHCLNNPKTIVSIVRKTFPTLRATVYRDMVEILREMNIYQENAHNKTENIYNFENGSYIQFFSCDDEQKLRGRQHDIVWCNEANELDFEDFQQLNMRTTGKMIFDFNPSDLFSWLNTLLERDNAVKIHSTYKDNPFLNDNQINEIEALKDVDENYYKIYALGLPATAKSTIFTHWKQISSIPEKAKGNFKYGLDFGYTHPSAITKIYQFENEFYVEEILYEAKLTAQDLVARLPQLGISKTDEIYADYARPEMIADIRKAGYNIKEANKSVKEGIDWIKSNQLFVVDTSINLIKEFKTYKFKTNGDQILEEPVKVNDDLIDSFRYGAIAFKKNTKWDYDIVTVNF
jgi:phage terminase large subunit